MHYTTLCRLKNYLPSENFKRLLTNLGKTEPDDEPLSLRVILDFNGLWDALSALRAIDRCPEKPLFAVRCVRQSAQHLLTDPRSLHSLDIIELHAVGEATDKQLDAAREAAVDAVRAAEAAARLAAERAIEQDFKDIFCS